MPPSYSHSIQWDIMQFMRTCCTVEKNYRQKKYINVRQELVCIWAKTNQNSKVFLIMEPPYRKHHTHIQCDWHPVGGVPGVTLGAAEPNRQGSTRWVVVREIVSLCVGAPRWWKLVMIHANWHPTQRQQQWSIKCMQPGWHANVGIGTRELTRH